jgi:hypothetical protein
MTFEINKHRCEICKKKAKMAINDKDMRLHYCCENHINELWDKIGKP